MADYSKHKIEELEGICLLFNQEQQAKTAASDISSWGQVVDAQAYLNITVDSYQDQYLVQVTATPALLALTPDYDTLNLNKRLGLDTVKDPAQLDLEILLCLARAPIAYCFPSFEELQAAIRVRHFAVDAARRTELAFNPDGYERPQECWTYDENSGFLLRPGVDMVEALIKTTQPEVSGKQLYTFSCGRAAEYIVLLAIAQELKGHNQTLYKALEKQWQTRASWVVYHGNGEFCNLWERAKPFSLSDKCLEIYHWRDGVYFDTTGEIKMNEDIVRDKVLESKQTPELCKTIIERMMRYRDVRGVYAEGGCIDASRDVVRWVCPGTSDLVLGT